MAPANVKLNPAGVVIFTVGLILSLFYLFGLPDFFRSEKRVSMKELLAVSIQLAERGGERVKSIHDGNDLHESVKGKTLEGKKEMLTSGDLESHKAIYYGFQKMYPSIKVISEEHDVKPVDLSQIAGVGGKHEEVDEVVKSDQSIPMSRVAVWIDPLDATQEYTESLTEYVTVMVCVVVDGEPKIGVIYKPFSKEMVWAWDGYGHSKSLVQGKKEGEEHSIIVSRSHAGEIESIAKDSFGENVKIVPAGGAGYKTMEVIKGTVNAYAHVTLIKKWDICAGNAVLNAVGGKMTTLDGDYIDYSPNQNVKNERGLLATVNTKLHYDYLEKFGTKARKVMDEKQKH